MLYAVQKPDCSAEDTELGLRHGASVANRLRAKQDTHMGSYYMYVPVHVVPSR